MMKRYLSAILIMAISVAMFCSCMQTETEPSNGTFIKPEKYAAIVNVEINPSFDIYLDEEAVVLAIEPKNEAARDIDCSSYTGIEYGKAINSIMDTICEIIPVDKETKAVTKFIEGNENLFEIDIVKIANDACADATARETVNKSMESVLQIRLEADFGCQCLECTSNNWYERFWYSYGEWEREWSYEEYEQKLELDKYIMETMSKDDPRYRSFVERHENRIYWEFDIKEVLKQDYLSKALQGGLASRPHEETEITYKILDVVLWPSGAESDHRTEEFSPEEYFKKHPEDIGIIEGLQKVIQLQLKLYENDEDIYGNVSVRLYLCNDKWYADSSFAYSLGG